MALSQDDDIYYYGGFSLNRYIVSFYWWSSIHFWSSRTLKHVNFAALKYKHMYILMYTYPYRHAHIYTYTYTYIIC